MYIGQSSHSLGTLPGYPVNFLLLGCVCMWGGGGGGGEWKNELLQKI